MLRRVPDATVDVGIPTRGEPRYLAQAIDSVLAQTFTDWRLVISENGPGGGAVEELVQPYLADERISYSPTGEELSQAGNHTRVVRAGTAPYVVILHDDDWWGPSFLSSRIAFLDRHPQCGMVFSGARIVDQSGHELGRTKLPFRPGVISSAEAVPALVQRNFIIFPSALVRRSAYDAVGDAYSEDVTWIDQEMWLRLASRFPLGLIGEWDSYYRLHERQLSAEYRLRLGEKHLEVVDAASKLPGVTPAARRAARSRALLHCALDAIELGERRAAAGHLASALRSDPLVGRSADAVTGVLLAGAGLALGPVGTRLVTWSRRQRFSTRGTSGLVTVTSSLRGRRSPEWPARAD
jgi:hypothetical protein